MHLCHRAPRIQNKLLPVEYQRSILRAPSHERQYEQSLVVFYVFFSLYSVFKLICTNSQNFFVSSWVFLTATLLRKKRHVKTLVFSAEEPEWKQFPNNLQTTKINWTTNDITSDMYIFNMSADCNISNNQQSNIESLSQRQSRPR